MVQALQTITVAIMNPNLKDYQESADSSLDFLTHVFPGSSLAMRRFHAEVQKLNLYSQRYKGAIGYVLLTGETGVGKNYTARAISAHSQWLTLTEDERRDFYYNSGGRISFPPTRLVEQLLWKEHRSDRTSKVQRVPRLATVLGPQLADDLADSELFGHKKGAFTGAQETRSGIFGDTSVDDVLLDEIADLSLKVQAKLLHFLETRTFRPVGGLAVDERASDHRIFLATNRPLEEWVRSGRFREDLYWRIKGYRIHIPPLRDRRDVIPDLVRSVLISVNHRQRGDEQTGPSLDPISDTYCLLPRSAGSHEPPQRSSWVVRVDPEDLDWCANYDWPGNVRELRQALDLYVFHNGHFRLKDITATRESLGLRPAVLTSGETEALVSRAVDIYLRAVLDGLATPPGQPEEMLRHFAQIVKQAVYAFKTNTPLSKEQITQIFPSAKDAETTIGRWKRGNHQPNLKAL